MSTEKKSLTEVFIDTSYIISLVVSSDKHHSKARELSKRVREERLILVTTKAILLEVGNAFSAKYKAEAIKLIEMLEKDPSIKVVSLDQTLFDQAFEMFKRYDDKYWGLVDCVSFVVMRSRKIVEAFSADQHFNQAGFRALLLEK